jgi:hypothetical protein
MICAAAMTNSPDENIGGRSTAFGIDAHRL